LLEEHPFQLQAQVGLLSSTSIEPSDVEGIEMVLLSGNLSLEIDFITVTIV